MTIKPVLVPDQDAATLRKLMDRFAEVTTGPTRQELTESRAAVAAAQGVAEGSEPVDNTRGFVRGEVKKNNDGSYVATNQTGSRKIFKSEKAAKAHANSGKQGVAEDDVSALAGFAAGTLGGAVLPFAAGSLAIAFRDALRSTDELAKRRAQVDTAEIVALQRQIVSINKMIGRVKTDETKEKYQAMLKTAYEVLDELKARQDDQVAEGEGMSRAAKGYEKYGKEGMAALAKAGREGRALDPVRDKYNRYDEDAESDVTEAKPDVMRHGGDKTIRVVKKGGKPIGEIGTDSEASPGNGPYYVKLYDGSYDAVGFDSAEEALAELKYAVKRMSEGIREASPPGVFKQGDKVKVHGKFNATVVGQDGDTYYVQIDGQPGSQAVSAASLAKPEAGGFKPGAKLMYKGQPVTYIRPYAQDPGQSYVKIASGSDELVATADLQAAAVAESIDPVEQLRADIKRFAR